jgi:urease accessory protein
MMMSDGSVTKGWQGALELGFECRGARTELVHRRHIGPMMTQKALHPEGDGPCHAIVLHPPSGLVGGDRLQLSVEVGEKASALITTPGASKWYRSLGPVASSTTTLRVGHAGALEFLPREAILFDGAMADAAVDIDLAGGARLVAWDLWCLGRTLSGERFRSGQLRMRTSVRIGGNLRLDERALLPAGSPLLSAAAGLGGAPVFGTLYAVGPAPEASCIADCRSLPVREGSGGLTQLPGILCARYLGHSTEAAHEWFVALWMKLRPVMLDRLAVCPRIWAA